MDKHSSIPDLNTKKQTLQQKTFKSGSAGFLCFRAIKIATTIKYHVSALVSVVLHQGPPESKENNLF